MRTTTLIGGLTAATLTLALAACGGDDGDGGGLGTGDDYSVEGALAELPASVTEGEDGESDLMISTGDVTTATEAAGLERPDAGSDEIGRWVSTLTGYNSEEPPPTFVPLGTVFGRAPVQVDEFDDELGWSLLDVDSFVEQSAPPLTFSVVRGEFDDATLSDDLTETGDGIVSAGEGDDFQTNVEETTAARGIGSPLRLAQDGELIAASTGTPQVEAWLEGGDTLADDEGLAAIAKALDDADVISAIITRPESGFGANAMLGERAASPEMAKAINEQALPAPFDTVGVGWAVEDDEAVITMVFAHDDADAATSNADALETMLADGTSLQTNRPMSELYTLDEVTTDDTLAIATVHPGENGTAMTPYQAVVSRDLPFGHAE